jgi:hypothetical protein
MKPAEIVEEQWLQPAQTIMPGVAVEVGMKATHYRNPQTLGSAYCHPAERPLRCHIHDIGTVLRPAALEQSTPWHANMYPFIPGDRQAGNHCHPGITTVIGAIRRLLAWTDHRHSVPLRTQSFHKVREGPGDAVDFRGIGFSDNADVPLL